MKKFSKETQEKFTNRFTGEELSTYPTPFAALSDNTSRRTKDKNKLKSQIDTFNKRNVCKFCGGTREWIPGTNVIVCKNPDCKGHKLKSKDSDGYEVYEPSMKLMGNRGAAIAETLLG